MERFVKFEIHEYMDLHPSINIITFIADSLDEIKNKAMEYAIQMNSNNFNEEEDKKNKL